MINQSNWVNELVGIHFQREHLVRLAVAPTDESLAQLEELQSRGYAQVEWESPNAQCFRCNDLHKQVWLINEFIAQTHHDAPMFSKSHVGCKCFLRVTGIDQLTRQPLPTQTVVAY